MKKFGFLLMLVCAFAFFGIAARGEASDNSAGVERAKIIIEIGDVHEARSLVSSLQFIQPPPEIVVKRTDLQRNGALDESSPEGQLATQMILPRVRSQYMTDSGVASTRQTRSRSEDLIGLLAELREWEEFYGIKPQNTETYLTRLVNVYWAQITYEIDSATINIGAE
ncbi:MAG: hypothetical protein WEC84_02645 [Candidatus Andersenbacteria bacterium]